MSESAIHIALCFYTGLVSSMASYQNYWIKYFKIIRYLINFPEIINIITKIFQDFIRFDSLNTVLKFNLRRGNKPSYIWLFMSFFWSLQWPTRIWNKWGFLAWYKAVIFMIQIKNCTNYRPVSLKHLSVSPLIEPFQTFIIKRF